MLCIEYWKGKYVNVPSINIITYLKGLKVVVIIMTTVYINMTLKKWNRDKQVLQILSQEMLKVRKRNWKI